ncbi:MAG: hypothetical protein HY801_05545 [Candidatus Lindowbacteria bacterium]|nr:hypothetical protein [Candidatus Lindowbacteria bacterium]
MGFLDRDGLLRKEDLKIERVDLGGGDFVFVHEMTGNQRDQFENSLLQEMEGGEGGDRPSNLSLENFRAKLAVCTLCDEKGNLLLRPRDAQKLSTNMSAARLELIANRARKLNRISTKDQNDMLVLRNSGLSQSTRLYRRQKEQEETVSGHLKPAT